MSAVIRPETRADLRELLTLAWPVVLARVGIMTMGLQRPDWRQARR